MAEGRSNSGIARQLDISERTVEAASAQLFQKLDLELSPDVNRRPQASSSAVAVPAWKCPCSFRCFGSWGHTGCGRRA